MLAMALAIAVQPYIDANLLYKLAPAGAVGWYGAAWVIAGTLVAPATILGAAIYPRLSVVALEERKFGAMLQTSFRPLLVVAVLGAVGTFLFADFAVGVIYGEQKFGPTADVLRAFSPTLMLIYIDMLFGHAIVAVGKATQLAKAKVVAVTVTTLVELALIPVFQSRFSNGGMGIVLSMACGELVMVTAAVLLLRNSLERGMLLDVLRAVAAGCATIALFRQVSHLSPLVGIPACVATFLLISALAGLVKPSDLELFFPKLRRRQRLVPETSHGD
jgi:O-antigen/teichoic acid export membrane protein